jgi:hypothetical protein
MLPLAAWILALCDMRLDKIYFSWSMVSIANTVVFNILVRNYKPVIIERVELPIDEERTLLLNEDIYSFFWVLC